MTVRPSDRRASGEPLPGALLYAVEDPSPRRLVLPAPAAGFDGVHDGLALGVYEAMRTFEHVHFLDLDGHLQRLQRSIERLGWRYPLDQPRLRRAIHAVCSAAPFPEMRVRVDVLAAPATARGSDSRELIALAPFTPPPPALYSQGVAVATTGALTRRDPLAKTADFVTQRRRIERANPQVHEHLIVEADGSILEGFSSNVYVVRDGTLITAGTGVLEGVTRRLVLALARELGVPLRLEAPHLDELATIQEAAISSSSRGLVPVVRIDEQRVGDGVPGPVVTSLGRAYDARVRREMRTAC